MKHLLVAATLIMLISCDSGRVYEENKDFESAFWQKDSVPAFKFEIEDASVSYNILINIRNGFEYPFYNLYYQYELKDSLGHAIGKEMQEILLFDAKTGEPLGSGLGDLFDHQQPVLSNYQFPFEGDYTIEFTHFMRADTLPLIVSVGARVEQSELKSVEQ